MDLVNRLVGRAGKSKLTSICPFLYHLYEGQGLLTEEEKIDYRATQELTQYRITLDWDVDSDHKSEEVQVITTPTPQKPTVAPMNQLKWGKRLKQTYMASEGSPLVWSKGEGSRPQPEQP